MKYQNKPHWCGPAAIQNAREALGMRHVGQARVAKLCGTDEEPKGSDWEEMVRGCLALGLGVDIRSWSNKRDAESWLSQSAKEGAVLLCVEQWRHWVAVAGCSVDGDYLCLIDSDTTDINKAKNGHHWLRTDAIVKRWKSGRRLAKGCTETYKANQYYGIAILKVGR